MPKRKPASSAPSGSTLPQVAIHIGAGSVSMMVAERRPDGSLRPLDFLEQPVPIARDLFRNGIISQGTTERVVAILRNYQSALLELGIHTNASGSPAT